MSNLHRAVLASAFLLVGCGGDTAEVAELRASCKEDGELTNAECDCMVDRAAVELTEEQIVMLTSVAGDGQPPANVTQADMIAIMSFAMEAEEACSAG